MERALRIAIITGQQEVIPAWSAQMLSEIIDGGKGELVVHIRCNQVRTDADKTANVDKTGLKYYCYNRFQSNDRKKGLEKCNAFEDKSISNFSNLDSIQLEYNVLDEPGLVEINNTANLEDYQIDLIVNLTQYKIDGKISSVPDFGIWSFCFGANSNDPTIPLFWQVLESKGESGVSLVMTKEDRQWVLYESTALIDNKSPRQNLNRIYWKIYSSIPRKIEEIFKIGKSAFLDKVESKNQIPIYYCNYKNEIPKNGIVLSLLARNYFRRIINKIKSLIYINQWMLLFHIDEKDTLERNFNDFIKMIPPKDRIWADPHIIERDNKYYIFIEELIYKEDKGYISVIIMDKQGNYEAPKKVLETDYHLSYPFLIEDQGELYMIPETKQTKNIQLFKCVSFPDQWEFEKVLIDGVEAADTTIIQQDDKFWLFTNYVRNKCATKHDELFLYSANELKTDEWIEHPENPIVTDVKNARPAGSFFTYKNRLYRPSQNCAKKYGFGLQLNRILKIDEVDFDEETISTINPEWDRNIVAIHTFARNKALTVIDARLKRRKEFF